MRDLGGRLLLGLAAVAAGVMAVGYALIFGGIAEPPTALGLVELPADGQVVPTTLDDGLPVFVTVVDGTAWVLDAREPGLAGELSGLVSWCASDGAFVGTRPTSLFAPDGSMLRPGPGGLVAHATSPADGDPSRVRVESRAGARPLAAEQRNIAFSCGADDWVVHRPQADDIFDPSVALEVEPRGWTWLEGSVLAIGNQALLCDGLAPDGCPAGAVARGIDPATLPAGGIRGTFLGRIRDGAIEGLTFAPTPHAAETP